LFRPPDNWCLFLTPETGARKWSVCHQLKEAKQNGSFSWTIAWLKLITLFKLIFVMVGLKKNFNIFNIYVKNCSVYIQCKGDIVVVDIKQHRSQFINSNFTITQSAKFF